MKIFKYLFKENPVFVLVLGLCSTLAVTTTFEKSYMMGLVVMIILILSNLIVSLIRKYVNNEIRIPVYIIIISTLVTIIEIFLSRYSKPLYDSFGIYLPLVVVNCIILGRALSYASKHKVINSLKDALKCGIGYLVAISIIGLLREVLGNGTLTLMNDISSLTGYKEVIRIFNGNIFPNKLFLTSGGAFILLGIIIGFINSIKKGKEV
ncbi:MAG: electron transport complex subunit RsxE [Clostridia bacterium]|nr:electron transport complex subunit RsxE [Clostridia bacterium]